MRSLYWDQVDSATQSEARQAAAEVQLREANVSHVNFCWICFEWFRNVSNVLASGPKTVLIKSL